MNPNAWRALVSALSDDRARTAYAAIVLGHSVDEALAPLPPAKADRVLRGLTAAGLVQRSVDGWRAVPEVFAQALAAAPRPERPRGVDRFLVDGRIASFPSRAADRRELLEHVVSTVLSPDETTDEAEINERLSTKTDDVAGLRRALVDAGLLTRTASGDAYSRPERLPR